MISDGERNILLAERDYLVEMVQNKRWHENPNVVNEAARIIKRVEPHIGEVDPWTMTCFINDPLGYQGIVFYAINLLTKLYDPATKCIKCGKSGKSHLSRSDSKIEHFDDDSAYCTGFEAALPNLIPPKWTTKPDSLPVWTTDSESDNQSKEKDTLPTPEIKNEELEDPNKAYYDALKQGKFTRGFSN